ncbi:MAG: TIM barrel protein [Candidatus Solibacter sp.]|nr:TIM barrel protein [Candidatus Solibacter sp.]
MTRRNFIATSAATAVAAAMPPQARCKMGFTPDSFAILRPPRTAIEFLEKAHAVGAGGVQASLASFEPDYLKKVRQKKDELGMYLEVLAPMPGPDTTQFEKTLQAAKEAGAESVRSACLSGRRYETFNTLEAWNTFKADSIAKIERALPLANKHKMPVGIENHKDWTVEEYVVMLKKYSSEYLGVCIDFGNNMSLLDDPTEVVESLAPYVINNHIKDMAVEEYEDGFLLSEVPLGKGMLDLKRMVAAVLKARPSAKFSLDMLTRDPLKITCLTEKYWVTFPARNGKYLARMLALVKKNKPAKPLARVTGMDREAQLRMEMDYLTQSIAYARDDLGLRY